MPIIYNSIPSDDKLLNYNELQLKLLLLSEEINAKICAFEKDNDIEVMASGQGYLQYPELYPTQTKVQMFVVYPRSVETSLNQ